MYVTKNTPQNRSARNENHTRPLPTRSKATHQLKRGETRTAAQALAETPLPTPQEGRCRTSRGNIGASTAETNPNPPHVQLFVRRTARNRSDAQGQAHHRLPQPRHGLARGLKMESDELLPVASEQRASGIGGRGVLPGIGDGGISTGRALSSPPRSSSRPRLLTRQDGLHADDTMWESSELATAISRDLVAKAEQWRKYSWEPLLIGPAKSDTGGHHQLPNVCPVLAPDIDKHEVASIYVKDALAGRDSSACIHDRTSLSALKLVRNKAWNQLLNICTIFHLILPMIEIPRCLPCMGLQKLSKSMDPDSLHEGWRPTSLGATWIECVLCLLYIYDLRQENSSRCGSVHAGSGGGGGGGKADESTDVVKKRLTNKYARTALPPWQLARTCMVVFLALGLVTSVFSHYVFEITWHSWGRVILPFLFISRRTYLKHFVAGIIRVLPRMLPVAFLMSFVIFFYGFLGYIVYRNEPRQSSILGDLELFDEPASSALTFLRIFTGRSFMLDVEVIFGGRDDIQVMILSYAVIMLMFLGALIPAVANRNFRNQSRDSWHWVKEQRKLALTRAYMMLKMPDGTVMREDWVLLMARLRPDCHESHTSALFGAAKKAEERSPSPSADEDRNRLSKAGFFMLCALGTANFSQGADTREKMYRNRRTAGKWARIRMWLDAVFSWSFPRTSFPLSHQILNLALLIQGYQIVREGDEPEGRPSWAYPLGQWLIAYFCLQAVLRMVAEGPRSYLTHWRNSLGMVLNLIGVAYYAGLWPPGIVFHNFYNILQASRLIVLWNVLHLVGSTTSEVARRLETVFPALIRASVVPFAVTYSYSVVAYAMYCATPMGQGGLEDVKDNTMVQRFEAVKQVASFASLHESFASMLYIIMLSNWPMFMDAAGVIGNQTVARVFFYSFKVSVFYVIQPVTLGFIVQSYMAAQLPDAAKAAFKNPGQTGGGGGGDSASISASGRSRAGDGAAGGDGGSGKSKASPKRKRGEKSRILDGGVFGYSTLADGAHAEIDIAALVDGASRGGGEDDDDHDNDDGSGGDGDDSGDQDDDPLDDDAVSDDDIAPVMIASRNRSMSQQFWGLEQAKDASTPEQTSAVMQGTVNRLETENATLREENSSLRALVGSMKDMAATGTIAVASSGAAPSNPSEPLRRLFGSGNPATGMAAIVEAEEEEAGDSLA